MNRARPRTAEFKPVLSGRRFWWSVSALARARYRDWMLPSDPSSEARNAAVGDWAELAGFAG
jgi:hypothetical protein